jgi:hypothetical protein
MDALSGQSDAIPGLITLSFPNLTAGAGGVGATNSNEDWVRAIRHGVGHDGRGLLLMPVRLFYYLSDEDLGALIAYLKSLPPVDNELPMTNLGALGRVMLVLGQVPQEAVCQRDCDHHDSPRPSRRTGCDSGIRGTLQAPCLFAGQLNGQMISEGGPDYSVPT